MMRSKRFSPPERVLRPKVLDGGPVIEDANGQNITGAVYGQPFIRGQ